ncbi:MAG: bifunctional glutamate N-acetyltransferase/amino-acid acetyltransferase ArgJ [Spirochaetota bacterium]|nr:bifunctional glutamate N-acetyltransferase/amino-acid acetyltransferase ArgJ [Spirochaetota bacterium]
MSAESSYPKGFQLLGVPAGIKNTGKLDMGIIYSAKKCVYAGVFTQNKIQAAPVKLCKARLENDIHGLVVNSGNANSFTGERGMRDTERVVELAESCLDLGKGSMLSLSTGVIGEYMPMDRVESGVRELCRNIQDGLSDPAQFALSIMTTDTRPKEILREIEIGGKKASIYGSCKGAGMIYPNMATMLAFIVTDICIDRVMLDQALKEVVEDSFNSVSVDGDQSTNDSVILLSNGEADNEPIVFPDSDYNTFRDALMDVAVFLAQSIVRDGEGATKFVEIAVKGAKSFEDARLCAAHLSNSLLVKTAFFGEDANWGRFIYAVGASGCEVDETRIDMRLGDIDLVKGGVRTGFLDDEANKYMKNSELYLEVNLNLGEAEKTMYTCDLSYDYVKINGDYRS